MKARLNRNALGALSLSLGILVFSTQDAIIKTLSGDHAVTIAMFIRSVVALPIILVLIHLEGGWRRLISRNSPAMAVRGLILLCAYTTYYMAIAALPLADAIALFFIAPPLITAFAPMVLGERIGARAILAVAIGFAGVLIMTRPGSGVFEPAALLSIASATCYAGAMLYARKLGATEPASIMTFYQNLMYLIGAGLIALTLSALGIVSAPHPSLDFLVRPWTVPPLGDFGLMALCGVIAAIAMALLTQAYRMAEARIVTVFEYTAMIWVPLWGYLFFAERPSLTTVAGAATIFAAGMLALWPERGRAPTLAPQRAVPPRVRRLLDLRTRRQTVARPSVVLSRREREQQADASSGMSK